MGPPRNCIQYLIVNQHGQHDRVTREKVRVSYSDDALDMLCHLCLLFFAWKLAMVMGLRSRQGRSIDRYVVLSRALCSAEQATRSNWLEKPSRNVITLRHKPRQHGSTVTAAVAVITMQSRLLSTSSVTPPRSQMP